MRKRVSESDGEKRRVRRIRNWIVSKGKKRQAGRSGVTFKFNQKAGCE